jgi:hypothetical protein
MPGEVDGATVSSSFDCADAKPRFRRRLRYGSVGGTWLGTGMTVNGHRDPDAPTATRKQSTRRLRLQAGYRGLLDQLAPMIGQ